MSVKKYRIEGKEYLAESADSAYSQHTRGWREVKLENGFPSLVPVFVEHPERQYTPENLAHQEGTFTQPSSTANGTQMLETTSGEVELSGLKPEDEILSYRHDLPDDINWEPGVVVTLQIVSVEDGVIKYEEVKEAKQDHVFLPDVVQRAWAALVRDDLLLPEKKVMDIPGALVAEVRRWKANNYSNEAQVRSLTEKVEAMDEMLTIEAQESSAGSLGHDSGKERSQLISALEEKEHEIQEHIKTINELTSQVRNLKNERQHKDGTISSLENTIEYMQNCWLDVWFMLTGDREYEKGSKGVRELWEKLAAGANSDEVTIEPTTFYKPDAVKRAEMGGSDEEQALRE